MICLSIAMYMISFNNLLAIFCGMITARYSDECLTALFVAGVKSSLPERIVLSAPKGLHASCDARY